MRLSSHVPSQAGLGNLASQDFGHLFCAEFRCGFAVCANLRKTSTKSAQTNVKIHSICYVHYHYHHWFNLYLCNVCMARETPKAG